MPTDWEEGEIVCLHCGHAMAINDETDEDLWDGLFNDYPNRPIVICAECGGKYMVHTSMKPSYRSVPVKEEIPANADPPTKPAVGGVMSSDRYWFQCAVCDGRGTIISAGGFPAPCPNCTGAGHKGLLKNRWRAADKPLKEIEREAE